MQRPPQRQTDWRAAEKEEEYAKAVKTSSFSAAFARGGLFCSFLSFSFGKGVSKRRTQASRRRILIFQKIIISWRPSLAWGFFPFFLLVFISRKRVQKRGETGEPPKNTNFSENYYFLAAFARVGVSLSSCFYFWEKGSKKKTIYIFNILKKV